MDQRLHRQWNSNNTCHCPMRIVEKDTNLLFFITACNLNEIVSQLVSLKDLIYWKSISFYFHAPNLIERYAYDGYVSRPIRYRIPISRQVISMLLYILYIFNNIFSLKKTFIFQRSCVKNWYFNISSLTLIFFQLIRNPS